MSIYPRDTLRKGRVYDVVVSQGYRRVTQTCYSLDEAKRVETKLSYQRDQGDNISQSRVSVRDYLEQWIAEYGATLPSERTAKGYRQLLQNHIIPQLGHRKLKDLQPPQVQRRYAEIMETRSQKTCLNVHRVLSEALKQAVDKGLIARNVCSRVTPPRPRQYRPSIFNDEELQRVLKAAEETLLDVMVPVALTTGLRESELLALKWDDIRGSTLYVRKAKWASERAVVLPAETVDLLQAHAVIGGSDGWVFQSKGKPLTKGQVRWEWLKIRQRAGITQRFHDLRHAHASLLIRAGVSVKIIQERLGHRSIATTLNIYGHLMPGMQEEAVSRMSDLLRGAK